MSEKPYVKLFEDLDQEGAFDSEIKKPLPDPEPEPEEEFIELTNTIDTENLVAGQKAAMERGDDILTPSQYAACYIIAQNRIGNSEDTRRPGDTSLTRTAQNITADEDERWENATADKLGFYMGRKPSTVSWTVRKFKLMLDGNMEGTANNVLFDLIIRFFKQFQRMDNTEVIAGAELAITEDPNDDDAYSNYMDQKNASSSKSTAKRQMERANIRPEIRRNVLGLQQAGKSLADSVRIAIAGLANSTGMTRKSIAEEGMIEFKNEEFMQREFRKLLKTL